MSPFPTARNSKNFYKTVHVLLIFDMLVNWISLPKSKLKFIIFHQKHFIPHVYFKNSQKD